MPRKIELPLPPQFATFEEERRHRKARQAAALRLFARFGFDDGITGHVTTRDPEHPDLFWVNPVGAHFRHIRVSDLILANHHGEVVEGDRPVNAAAFTIHSQIHEARPDVTAVAHAHTLHGKTWSATGRPIEPITQDACVFYEDHAIFEYTGLVLSNEEARALADCLGPRKALILTHHGLLTVGHTMDEAAWWLMALDRACQGQILAATCAPARIEHELARRTGAEVGCHLAGWFSFQPLYDMIVREEPDLLQ